MDTQTIVEFTSGNTDSVAKVKTDSIVEDRFINEFQKELREYVGTHPGTILHLDLSHVQRFSCAVLADLLQIQQELAQTRGSLRLQGIHGNIRDIMKLTGMGKMFTVEHRRAS